MVIGTNAKPDDTIITVDSVCFRNTGSSAAVNRIGPSKFVLTIASETAASIRGPAKFSILMIPELLISTFVAGNSAATRPAKASIDSESSTSSVTAWIPLFPRATSSSAPFRLPATITSFPRSANASANPRPIPDPPPVITMVLPLIFMKFTSPHDRPRASLFVRG